MSKWQAVLLLTPKFECLNPVPPRPRTPCSLFLTRGSPNPSWMHLLSETSDKHMNEEEEQHNYNLIFNEVDDEIIENNRS